MSIFIWSIFLFVLGTCLIIYVLKDYRVNKDIIDETCKVLDEQIGYKKCLQDNVYPYQNYIEYKLETLSHKIPKLVSKRKPRYLKRRH